MTGRPRTASSVTTPLPPLATEKTRSHRAPPVRDNGSSPVSADPPPTLRPISPKKPLQVANLVAPSTSVALSSRFRAIDTESTGLVSISKYRQLGSSLGLADVPEEAWCQIHDADGDGFVTQDEFVAAGCLETLSRDVGPTGLAKILPAVNLRKARLSFLKFRDPSDTLPAGSLNPALAVLHESALSVRKPAERATFLELARRELEKVSVDKNQVNWSDFLASQARLILALHKVNEN